MKIKAIETEYDGHKFRSRAEARWAVFFNAGGVKYEYEPEGFELTDGERYLPDFYLPEFEMHVEVKGKRDGYENEILRIPKFIYWGGPIKRVLILSSDIPGITDDHGLWHFPVYYYSARYSEEKSYETQNVNAGWFFFTDNGDTLFGNVSAANYPSPCIHECDYERGQFCIDAKSDMELRGKKPTQFDVDFSNHTFNKLVFDALLAARQARFEHGETPVIRNVG